MVAVSLKKKKKKKKEERKKEKRKRKKRTKEKINKISKCEEHAREMHRHTQARDGRDESVYNRDHMTAKCTITR